MNRAVAYPGDISVGRVVSRPIRQALLRSVSADGGGEGRSGGHKPYVKRRISSSVEIVVRAGDGEPPVLHDKLLIVGTEIGEFGDRRDRSALILEQHYSARGDAGMLIKSDAVALSADLLLLGDDEERRSGEAPAVDLVDRPIGGIERLGGP